MSEENKDNPQLDNYDPPTWLKSMLRASTELELFSNDESEIEDVSAAFHERCQEAADLALSLIKLRQERQRVGFVPLSFADYVQGLVRVANVRLSAVLQWLRIDDLSRPTPDCAKAFVKLAKEIDLGLRETLIHIRIGFAILQDSAPVPLLVARHRSPTSRGDELEQCEAVLGKLEAKYELDDLRELRRTEFEIRAAFRGYERSA